MSKWFDGYNDEVTIFIDDVNRDKLKEFPAFSYYIKAWSDKFPVRPECKSGYVGFL
jgi:hypothetical protein